MGRTAIGAGRRMALGAEAGGVWARSWAASESAANCEGEARDGNAKNANAKIPRNAYVRVMVCHPILAQLGACQPDDGHRSGEQRFVVDSTREVSASPSRVSPTQVAIESWHAHEGDGALDRLPLWR